MIRKIGEYTTRQYDILLASALKSIGYKGDCATAAAFVYQIDYWIDKNIQSESNKPSEQRNHYKCGKWWAYNTIIEWQLQFSYVTEKTVFRMITELKRCKIIETGRFNKKKYDKTNWYTLNYQLIQSLMQREMDKLSISNNDNLSKSKRTNCLYAIGQNNSNNTKEYSRNNSYNTHKPDRKNSRFGNEESESPYAKMNYTELEEIFLEN